MKFWNFSQNKKETEVELRINGELIDDEEAWIYEWFAIPCSSPNAFREEIKEFTGKTIHVWIDSYGGSVFAGMGIYNALMEHRRQGGHVVTIGDSKVMSAATIIFMAGEKRKMTPGCVFMVHNPLTSIQQGYACDFRKAADVLDTIKDTIMNVYETSTGMDRNEISKLMDEETYMSAETAVKYNFATETMEIPLSVTNTAHKNIDFNREKFINFQRSDMKKIQSIIKSDGGETMKEVKTVQDLTAAYGELVNQIQLEAVQMERERMTALDALDDGTAQVHAIIMHAKENGQTSADVQFFVDTAKANTQEKEPESNGNQFMNNLVNDNKQSGVESVKSYEKQGKNNDAEEIKSFVNALNKAMGGKTNG